MILDPHDPEWDDVNCPACEGSGQRVHMSYADEPGRKYHSPRIIKTTRNCELCEGGGVVSPSVFDDYRRDPLGALARRVVR